MRNYKFRGKRKDNNEWVYGSLVNNFQAEICDESSISGFREEVHEETVGVYINLLDKFRQEAYTGDIVKQTKWGEERFYKIFEVKGGFAINTHQSDFHKPEETIVFYESLADMQTSSWFESSVEIIGNIHEESPKEDKQTF